jgi:hypothetical protein
MMVMMPADDTILVPYNNKNYYINIVESKPQDAISIVETDCEVDFAPPLDYVEPEPQPRPPLAPSLGERLCSLLCSPKLLSYGFILTCAC